MKDKKLSLTVMVLALMLAVNTASAHSPYILPFQFNTDKDVVTLHAGLTEKFFEPDFPGGGVEGGYEVIVTNPSGETRHAEQISKHKQLTLIEVDTKNNGTYKIDRLLMSRVFSRVLRDGKIIDVRYGVSSEKKKEMEAQRAKGGELKFLFEDEVKPDEVQAVQFINHVTTYVTKDRPSDAALKITKKGFEFDFKTHPNVISVKSGLKLAALLDGKVAAGITFELFQEDDEPVQSVKSDSNGLVDISFKQAGVYVLKAAAPLETVNNGKIANPQYVNWLIIEVLP
jgi:hypothetical protein